MEKDFFAWHDLKRKVQNEKNRRPYVHRREVWYCYVGQNIGYEQDGKGPQFLRPVLVIRKFNNEVFWAVPLTSAQKSGPYYFQVAFNGRSGSAILSQLKLIDGKRLSHKIGDIPEQQFVQITAKLKELIP